MKNMTSIEGYAKGGDVVESALDAGPCLVTTVNTCEVLGKLREKGMPLAEARLALHDLGLTVVDFDFEQAALAAEMRVRTKPIGASLGDRACLALAQHRLKAGVNPTVHTAQHSWIKLKWPFKIALIRPVQRNT